MIDKCILKLCENRKITLNKLAQISGVPRTTLYSIISGESKNPGIKTIVQICIALDISLVDFFREGEAL